MDRSLSRQSQEAREQTENTEGREHWWRFIGFRSRLGTLVITFMRYSIYFLCYRYFNLLNRTSYLIRIQPFVGSVLILYTDDAVVAEY